MKLLVNFSLILTVVLASTGFAQTDYQSNTNVRKVYVLHNGNIMVKFGHDNEQKDYWVKETLLSSRVVDRMYSLLLLALDTGNDVYVEFFTGTQDIRKILLTNHQ